MNRKRETLSNSATNPHKRPKHSPDELPANLISSGSSIEEIPETPPEASPRSINSATPPPSSPTPTANLISDINLPGATTSQVEESLIQEIESGSSSSSSSCRSSPSIDTDHDPDDHFDAATLIESDSDAPSQDQTQLPAAITQRAPCLQFVQPKDTVDIPLAHITAARHPLTVISARPVPARNGLADELKTVLVAYRSKENFWQHDHRLGIADPLDTEFVQVTAIKKFHSYCLFVEVKRGRLHKGSGGGGEPAEESTKEAETLLLNYNWDIGFKALQVGDKLIVNFRNAEPIPFNGKPVHFFPFARRQAAGGCHAEGGKGRAGDKETSPKMQTRLV